jgi:hypothetical protein
MKKYLLVLGFGLLSTAAVTAAVLDKDKGKEKVKKEKKMDHKNDCSRYKRHCIFS